MKWCPKWDSNPHSFELDFESSASANSAIRAWRPEVAFWAFPTFVKCISWQPFWFLVGMTGFEPAALWSQTRCATKLRYIPITRYRCHTVSDLYIIPYKKLIVNYFFVKIFLKLDKSYYLLHPRIHYYKNN